MVSPPQGDKSVEKLKVPPHSIEAEQSVLGSMLIDPESWDKVAELVTDTDFYNRSHQIIFRAIIRLLNNSNPVDLITVSEELEKHDELEDAGGDRGGQYGLHATVGDDNDEPIAANVPPEKGGGAAATRMGDN